MKFGHGIYVVNGDVGERVGETSHHQALGSLRDRLQVILQGGEGCRGARDCVLQRLVILRNCFPVPDYIWITQKLKGDHRKAFTNCLHEVRSYNEGQEVTRIKEEAEAAESVGGPMGLLERVKLGIIRCWWHRKENKTGSRGAVKTKRGRLAEEKGKGETNPPMGS